MFDIDGPTLWVAFLIHDQDKTSEQILKAFDEEIERVQKTPVTQDDLDLALVKARSALFAEQEDLFGFGRANLLAAFALFDDNPGKINTLEDEFRKVTPELVRKTALEYLRPGNRTILTVTPKAQGKPAGKEQ
jgi:predicted Zn-dependent peptidase